MYQRYYKQDPILLRLDSATVSALYDANIKCIENLFRLNENDLLNIPKIGPKRVNEIMNLLTGLPFEYMDETLPRNPEQNPNEGVNPALINLLTDYRSEKYYRRGLTYFQQNKVGEIELQHEATQSYRINVYGTRPYTVNLALEGDETQNAHCTCPAFSQSYYWYENCKHIYAAALALAEQQRLKLFENIDAGNYAYKQLMRRIEAVNPQSTTPSNQPLEYYLVRKGKQWDLYPKKTYHALHSSNRNNYQWYHNPWEDLAPGNAKDRLIASYLKQIYSPDNYGYSSKNTGQTIGDVLELLKDRSVYLKEGKTTQLATIKFEEEPLNLLIGINRAEETSTDDNTVEDGLSLHFLLQNSTLQKRLNEVEVVCKDPCWIFDGTSLNQINGSDWARNFFLNTPLENIRIPVDEIEPFLQDFYPALQKAKIPVRIADKLTKQKAVKTIPRLYLHENARKLEIQLKFAYGNIELQYNDQRRELLLPVQQDQTKNEHLFWSVRRDIKQEEACVDELQESGLVTNAEFRPFIPEEAPLEWVIEKLPKLAEKGYEIYGEQQLKRYARPKKLTSSSFRVQSRENWFELEGEITFGDITLNMRDIHSVLIKNKPYVRLQDGSTGELTKNWLKRLKQVMQLMPDEKQTRIPKIAAPAIKEIGETADNYTSDIEFDQYVNRLQEFENIEQIDAPETFNGDLRPYQLAGLSWMNFLHQYNFGGILADDMGLGKTVQVLALLQKVHKQTGSQPKTLVIAPLSVIHNWQKEADNFTPDFSVYIHHGPDRLVSLEDWPDVTLSITTYATMRNDIEMISSKTFDYIILDESHTIRNPSSKTSRATRKLTGHHRLCLTGTPVQNTTMDLWPQFEFINPGLLGSQRQFRDQWVKPLEKNKDQTVEEMLHKMVTPFIMRRIKQKVANDLPPLTTSRVDCTMDSTQQQVYEKYRQTYYRVINDSIDENGVRGSRFTVLEGLTRLRQICCSPQLIDGETGNSSKLTRFMEMAEGLIREGHRALVFSQFVSFLHQIEAEVKNRGWQYEYLDGQTRNRQERVDRFQSDDSKNLFLISLKAGGEGLNLTAADYVFLMDPWWNPAAERQAMDRTHRIGQNNHVFVYRFVCPGTVEEKILRLQERKRSLAQKLIVAEAGIFKELERDDLLALFE